MKFQRVLFVALVCLTLISTLAFWQRNVVKMGRQPDGTFIVSSGQHIVPGTFWFSGRPGDIALHPSGKFFAVTERNVVFLCRPDEGIIANSSVPIGAEPGFRGLEWTPDGKRLIASTAAGWLATYDYDGEKLTAGHRITLLPDANEQSSKPDKKPKKPKKSGAEITNPVPGGMAITKDGKTLYVAAADLNAVVQVDLTADKVERTLAVGTLPFQVRLSSDESKLVVTNWAGRIPRENDVTGPSGKNTLVVDKRGAAAGGTVTILDLATGEGKSVDVGIHPTDVVVDGDKGYVANSLSDSISVIDLNAARVSKTIPLQWNTKRLIGCMPCALGVSGDRLYACDGGDNALCEVDLGSDRVVGYRPAGYYPIAMFLLGDRAVVLNSKGDGSVYQTRQGKIGNAHDFEGSLSVIDLKSDIAAATKVVADNNSWDKPNLKPDLAVYHGAIQHVLYIIKENRTYDEIYGDMPEGNGDPKLCDIGEKIMPNHRALAREFGLFDNAYVSGTNSCDGHAWSTQSMADDYIEHFYVGYSRTYNDDGNCCMSLSSSGCIWDAAAKKHDSIRIYGEYCDAEIAEYQPSRPKDWFEAWNDRKAGTHKFHYIPHAVYASVKPYLCPNVHYWPLIQSDQSRADEFIKEYTVYSREDKVPNLMVMSLPCDHTEGRNPTYPEPKSMMADNDLALGRIVDAVSHSPQWKNTCIFVIEDDAQSGPDHVDGHRTSYLVVSPYNRRRVVDSNLYTTVSMLKSIEMMLGLDPMNRFDSFAKPIDSCFTDQLDLTPYTVKPNQTPLDLPNPGRVSKATGDDEYWAEKTRSLDWSHLDAPDNYWLNRIIWASLHKDGTPYPAREGEAPGQEEDD